MPPATQETELTAAPTMSELSAANWRKRNVASTEGDVEDAQTRLTLPRIQIHCPLLKQFSWNTATPIMVCPSALALQQWIPTETLMAYKAQAIY